MLKKRTNGKAGSRSPGLLLPHQPREVVGHRPVAVVHEARQVGFAHPLPLEDNGLIAFLRLYVIKRGFLDGWAGFVIALGNFEGTFYRYAKLAVTQNGWNIPPVKGDG